MLSNNFAEEIEADFDLLDSRVHPRSGLKEFQGNQGVYSHIASRVYLAHKPEEDFDFERDPFMVMSSSMRLFGASPEPSLTLSLAANPLQISRYNLEESEIMTPKLPGTEETETRSASQLKKFNILTKTEQKQAAALQKKSWHFRGSSFGNNSELCGTKPLAPEELHDPLAPLQYHSEKENTINTHKLNANETESGAKKMSSVVENFEEFETCLANSKAKREPSFSQEQSLELFQNSLNKKVYPSGKSLDLQNNELQRQLLRITGELQELKAQLKGLQTQPSLTEAVKLLQQSNECVLEQLEQTKLRNKTLKDKKNKLKQHAVTLSEESSKNINQFTKLYCALGDPTSAQKAIKEAGEYLLSKGCIKPHQIIRNKKVTEPHGAEIFDKYLTPVPDSFIAPEKFIKNSLETNHVNPRPKSTSRNTAQKLATTSTAKQTQARPEYSKYALNH